MLEHLTVPPACCTQEMGFLITQTNAKMYIAAKEVCCYHGRYDFWSPMFY